MAWRRQMEGWGWGCESLRQVAKDWRPSKFSIRHPSCRRKVPESDARGGRHPSCRRKVPESDARGWGGGGGGGRCGGVGVREPETDCNRLVTEQNSFYDSLPPSSRRKVPESDAWGVVTKQTLVVVHSLPFINRSLISSCCLQGQGQFLAGSLRALRHRGQT